MDLSSCYNFLFYSVLVFISVFNFNQTAFAIDHTQLQTTAVKEQADEIYNKCMEEAQAYVRPQQCTQENPYQKLKNENADISYESFLGHLRDQIKTYMNEQISTDEKILDCLNNNKKENCPQLLSARKECRTASLLRARAKLVLDSLAWPSRQEISKDATGIQTRLLRELELKRNKNVSSGGVNAIINGSPSTDVEIELAKIYLTDFFETLSKQPQKKELLFHWLENRENITKHDIAVDNCADSESLINSAQYDVAKDSYAYSLSEDKKNLSDKIQRMKNKSHLFVTRAANKQKDPQFITSMTCSMMRFRTILLTTLMDDLQKTKDAKLCSYARKFIDTCTQKTPGKWFEIAWGSTAGSFVVASKMPFGNIGSRLIATVGTSFVTGVGVVYTGSSILLSGADWINDKLTDLSDFKGYLPDSRSVSQDLIQATSIFLPTENVVIEAAKVVVPQVSSQFISTPDAVKKSISVSQIHNLEPIRNYNENSHQLITQVMQKNSQVNSKLDPSMVKELLDAYNGKFLQEVQTSKIPIDVSLLKLDLEKAQVRQNSFFKCVENKPLSDKIIDYSQQLSLCYHSI